MARAREKESDPRRLPRPEGAAPARGSQPLLALQRAAGNRAVARLVAARLAEQDSMADDFKKTLAKPSSPSVDDWWREAVNALPAERAGEDNPFEVAGPIGKMLSETVEHAFEHEHLPRELFSSFAKAWDVIELYEAVRTRDIRRAGPAASTVAGVLERRASTTIEAAAEQGAKAPVRWVVTKVGARAFVLAWTSYEFFTLGAKIRELFGEDERRADARRDAWREVMMDRIWSGFNRLSPRLREEKFDELMGGRRGWGEVPALTEHAVKHGVDLMNEAADAWKREIDAMGVLPDREAIRTAARGLARHFAGLRDFDTDPANWRLTGRQRKLLGSAPADADEARAQDEAQVQASLPTY